MFARSARAASLSAALWAFVEGLYVVAAARAAVWVAEETVTKFAKGKEECAEHASVKDCVGEHAKEQRARGDGGGPACGTEVVVREFAPGFESCS